MGLLVTVFIMPPVTNADWSEFRITTSLSVQDRPDVYGNTVVWCDYRYLTGCIFGADISDPNQPTEFIVSKQSFREDDPQISGSCIAFRNYTKDYCSNNDSRYNIFINDGSVKQITNNDCSSSWVVFGGNDGEIVTWKHGSGIWGYEISTDSLFRASRTTSSYVEHGYPPDVSEGKIVWVDRDESDYYNIHVFNISEWKEYIVSSSPEPIESIRIDGNIIVFPANDDIYAIDISDLNLAFAFPICTDESEQRDPAISGNNIVWTDSRNGNSDIYGYNMLTQEEFCVTANPDNQTDPAIDGNTVVWVNDKNGQKDIYGAILGGPVIPYCDQKPHGDLNNDCKVTIIDFAIMASSWTQCNLEPESACWD